MKFEPYEHQRLELENHAEDKIRALFWQPRTGKTKLIIDSSYHLHQKGVIDYVVVIAPNGVHKNWVENEIPAHAWQEEPPMFYWNVKAKGEGFVKTLETKDKLGWFCFSINSIIRADVLALIAAIRKSGRFMLVFDESHEFRNPSAKTTMRAVAISRRAEYKRILTGTAAEESPLNLFSQFQLLREGCLGYPNYEAFKRRYAEIAFKQIKQGDRRFQVEFVKGLKNLNHLQDSLRPLTSLVLRSDCADIPNIIVEDVAFDLTPTQLELYEQVTDDFTFNIDGETFDLKLNAPKLIKLHQITSGFIKDKTGTVLKVTGTNPRLEAFKRVLYREADKNILVFAHFHEEFNDISNFLRSEEIDFLTYHGRTPEKEKIIARKMFHKASPPAKTKVILAHRQSAGAGLDFSQAKVMIDYSHTFNNFHVAQANERATAMGGDDVLKIRLVANKLDRMILNSLDKKTDRAETVTRTGLRG